MERNQHNFWLYKTANCQQTFPLGAVIMLRDFYVHDLISGAKSKEEADIIMIRHPKF